MIRRHVDPRAVPSDRRSRCPAIHEQPRWQELRVTGRLAVISCSKTVSVPPQTPRTQTKLPFDCAALSSVSPPVAITKLAPISVSVGAPVPSFATSCHGSAWLSIRTTAYEAAAQQDRPAALGRSRHPHSLFGPDFAACESLAKAALAFPKESPRSPFGMRLLISATPGVPTVGVRKLRSCSTTPFLARSIGPKCRSS